MFDKGATVLDQGYIKMIESWGSDERIIESARMSTGKGFLGWGPGHTCPRCHTITGAERDDQGTDYFCQNEQCPGYGRIFGDLGPVGPGDEKLLRFMWTHNHGTPFEFAGATFEIQAPICVFREWHRHRTQSYNEMSARYVPLPDVNYLPTPERLLQVSDGSNKQAGTIAGAAVLDLSSALEWLASLSDVYEHAEHVYQDGLRRGVPKELARLPVPVGRYSRMRATANLRNWLAFCTLRTTAKNQAAQWEIRQFANALHDLLMDHFPRTMALFDERTDFPEQRKLLQSLLEIKDIPSHLRDTIREALR